MLRVAGADRYYRQARESYEHPPISSPVIFVTGAIFLLLATAYFLRASDVLDLTAAGLFALLGIGLIIVDVRGELKNTL
jgi:hypothetical protein